MPSLQRSLPFIKRLVSADVQPVAAAGWLASLKLHTLVSPETSDAYSSNSGSSKDSGHIHGQQHGSTGSRHATALPTHLQFLTQSPGALFCTGLRGLQTMPERQCSLSASEQLSQMRPYANRVGKHQEKQRRRGAMSVRGRAVDAAAQARQPRAAASDENGASSVADSSQNEVARPQQDLPVVQPSEGRPLEMQVSQTHLHQHDKVVMCISVNANNTSRCCWFHVYTRSAVAANQEISMQFCYRP